MFDYLIPVLVFILSGVLLRLFRRNRCKNSKGVFEETFKFLQVWAGSISIVLLWHCDHLYSYVQNHADDSILTLEFSQIVFLTGISAALITLLFVGMSVKTTWLIERKKVNSPHLCLIVDVVASTVLFTFLLSLTPQIFYQYYLSIFENLESKIVVRSWFDYLRVVRTGTLSNLKDYADYLTAMTFWCLIVFTLLKHLIASPRLNRPMFAGSALITVVSVASRTI